ncbi:hypothetical protein [Salinispora fenicalii]|uniref:hypothetical protein n=1 Tax=Salinispora fenicalii TaxID=1137263 RepID=UPI000482ED2F|nr:hypothetical protein [Salinispora fenicalii]
MPFLDYDHEVRKIFFFFFFIIIIIIESLNARFRQAARRRGHCPTEQAATKVLHLIVGQRHKSGSITGRVHG